MQIHSEQETADKFNLTKDKVDTILKQAKEKLWKYRLEQRPKPHRDDKVCNIYGRGVFFFFYILFILRDSYYYEKKY